MLRLAYLVALGFACLLATWITSKVWRRWESTGARPLAGIGLATVVWAGGSLGLALAASPGAELRWLQFSYLGMVGAPIAFTVFALEYTGYQQYLTLPSLGGLFTLGIGFLGLVWTNPYHHLYWAKVEFGVTYPAGVSTTPGLGFWGFVLFTYLLLVLGSVLFVRYALTAPQLYRRQTIALLVAVGAPWAANIPHVFQLMTADLTPVALSITTVALWGAMTRYRLADLSPIALRTMFESISPGVYVLDRQDRIVDLNAVGREMIGATDDVIGTSFWDVVPAAFVDRFRDLDDHREIIAAGTEALAGVEESDVGYYDVRVTPINLDRGRKGGRLFVVDDVTEQERRRQQLKRQYEQLEKFSSVVSHDLRNPLNVALGNLSLAREEEVDSEYLDHTHRALTRMETLIDDLLALAHGGSRITDPEPVDLAAVVAEVWENVDTKQATLENRSEMNILADQSRLHQLIENLVRNAIEHGGETVTITIGDAEGGILRR